MYIIYSIGGKKKILKSEKLIDTGKVIQMLTFYRRNLYRCFETVEICNSEFKLIFEKYKDIIIDKE